MKPKLQHTVSLISTKRGYFLKMAVIEGLCCLMNSLRAFRVTFMSRISSALFVAFGRCSASCRSASRISSVTGSSLQTHHHVT